MLSEVLMSGKPPQRGGDRPPGLSISQLFPCPYRLWLIQMNQVPQEDILPQQYWNMDDGWDAEEQSVRRLKGLGVDISDRGAKVHIGRSKIPGSIDGTYYLNGHKGVWEHKAMGLEAYWQITNRGLDSMPNYKAQLNGYMLGLGLEEGCFFVKRKNDNNFWDKVYKIDRPFIEKIVEWSDKIRLEGWTPEPEECKWCAHCGIGCFGAELDFSWMGSIDAKEMAEKWIQGDKYEKVGSMLKDEARTYFVGDKKGEVEGAIGSRDFLDVAGLLQIKKVTQHRFDIDKQKVLEEFGPEGLMKVGEEKEVVQYRFKEV